MKRILAIILILFYSCSHPEQVERHITMEITKTDTVWTVTYKMGDKIIEAPSVITRSPIMPKVIIDYDSTYHF